LTVAKLPVSPDEIARVTRAALVAHGAEDWIAASVARAVARAEETGNVICGLYYLDSYCRQLTSGRISGTAAPLVTRRKPAAVEADARLGFAQPAFDRGLPEALTAARDCGSAVLAVTHSHTCTSLGYFTEQIAEAGLIGIGFTNASATVAPPGGTAPVLGTNPIAMAVPAEGGGVAFQFDQSTSAVALGKITMAAAAGEDIPLGWAVDADGRPTTDPNAALKGSLQSTGGYKGWSFGLMAEVLAACVTGTVNSLDVKALKAPTGAPHDLGQFYILIDPEVFAGAGFWQRLTRVADAVAAQEGARLPGSRRKAVATVPVDAKLWGECKALAGG
jgi:(2R)-3-sulfolactate dehydrogenase (NADP+)